MRGEIPVHLRDDDFGAFMCERNPFLFAWGMMISVHSCIKGGRSINSIFVHLPEEWRFSVHSFVRGKISVHLREGWWFLCFHVWGVGFRCIYLRSDDLRCIHVWEVRYRCIYLRDDDFGAFMCEGWDISAFTWGMMMSVHSCVRGGISLHLPEEWQFAVHSCVRGKIPVHLLEEWRCSCIHVWGVGYRCILSEGWWLQCNHVFGVGFRCI